MIIKQKHTLIPISKDLGIYYTIPEHDINEMKMDEQEAWEAYKREPDNYSHFRYIYLKADRLKAEGKLKEALEVLSAEHEAISKRDADDDDFFGGKLIPFTTLYIHSLYIKAEILLQMAKPDEALESVKDGYELAEEYFYGTPKHYFLAELYGVCLYATGDKDAANDYYRFAKDGLERFVQDATNSIRDIEKNLADNEE